MSTLSAGTYIFLTFEGIALLPPSVGGVVAKTVIFVKLPQLLKADCPIVATFSGITNDVKLLQNRKAYIPIFVTVFGIVIDAKLRQDSNAEIPIDVS